MKTKNLPINKVKLNPNNPRVIKDDKFNKLVKSIQEFPQMLELRPIVVNSDMVVLGGNMRLRACQEAGFKEIPVVIADELTEQEQKQFIIKDNVSFGVWDWDNLANEWDSEELGEWGIDLPNFETTKELDYSVLDDVDIDSQLDEMAGAVRKAIQIEFEPEHYEEAQELVKFWREQKLYIGGFLIEKLKQEKNALQ